MKQYDIYRVSLDPTIGFEIKNTRPCVVISPEEMNKHLKTVQIAPLTSNTRAYPWRAAITFQRKRGMVALDQLRTVDKRRLIKRLGRTTKTVQQTIKDILDEMLVQ